MVPWTLVSQNNTRTQAGNCFIFLTFGRLNGVLAPLCGVACSRCRLCERGHSPNDHKCFKDHHGSAKSMELALAVRMITQNQQLLKAQCVVSTLVRDEDSSTINAVRRESEVPVAKWADINHVEKSFTTALYNLKVGLSDVLWDGIT